jgi:hypothetical protein
VKILVKGKKLVGKTQTKWMVLGEVAGIEVDLPGEVAAAMAALKRIQEELIKNKMCYSNL